MGYIPDEGKYETIKDEKGYTGNSSNNYEFVTDNSLAWRIWSIDEEKITLIADKPTSVGGYKNLGALCLTNCNGYNNSVKILNEICMACYGNEEFGATSRSFNIDDIENVLNKEIWTPVSYIKKTSGVSYLGTKEYKNTLAYPYMYSLEKGARIDGIEKEEGSGISRSEQSTLCNANTAFLKAENTLSPVQTAWRNSNMTGKNFIDERYYYLIFKESFEKTETLMSYFVASRAVDLTESCANFGIFEVSMGNSIEMAVLFNSRGASLEYWDRIRPVIEIPSRKHQDR